VKLRSLGSDTVVGLGLVISKDGIIMVDKSTLAQLTGFEAVFANGTHFPMSIIQSQINGDIVFLAPTVVASTTFAPISFAPAPKLGQTILTLSGIISPTLAQGIISRTLQENINSDGSQPALIDTSISASKIILGSPLFNLDGEVIGMNTKTVSKDLDTAAFYPIMQLKGVVPKIQ
jgi:S1-C subfamily serine protease